MSDATNTQQLQDDAPAAYVPEYLADARHAMKDHGVHAHIAATFIMSLFPFDSYDAEDDTGSDTGAVENDDGQDEWEDEDDDDDAWEDESASSEAQDAVYTDLVKFIAYVLWYSRLPEPVFFGALYLLQKRKHINPTGAPQVQVSVHALFIIACIIANDILSDSGYKLNLWREIGSKRFEVRELATLKIEFCVAMGWNLSIRQAPLEDFMRRLSKDLDKKGEKEGRKG